MTVSATPHVDARRACWAVVVVSFVVLDVLVTMLAVGSGMATEAHPLVATAIRRYGVWVLPIWKVLAVAGFHRLYRWLPRDYDFGVPVGLALVGSAVFGWNVAVLLAAS